MPNIKSIMYRQCLFQMIMTQGGRECEEMIAGVCLQVELAVGKSAEVRLPGSIEPVISPNIHVSCITC